MTQQIYTLKTIGYRGATPQGIFTFTAKDDQEAASKTRGWCRYQGMQYEIDAIFTKAVGNELQWQLHNEYMNH